MTMHDSAHTTDEAMADEIRIHHAGMVSELDRLSEALVRATAEESPAARERLTDWFRDVLVPHADEEETTTYRAASVLPEGGRLLIEAMSREHVLIKRLVGLFAAADSMAEAAAYGRAAFEAFDSHQRKENDMILPLLVAAPTVSLMETMEGAHGHQVREQAHHAHANAH